MKLFGKLALLMLVTLLFLGCTSQQQQQLVDLIGNQTSGNKTCIQQDQLCGYGTASPSTLIANQSQFYGKCCEGYACIAGYCKKTTENCVAKGHLCAYGPTNLAHPDNMTYYGECCEGECTNGYCKPNCKASGSCGNASDCCSGLECRDGKCMAPCKTSGSCTGNSDCCGGYYCNQSMQCVKPCLTSANCSLNSDCCRGYFCGPDFKCTPEPQPNTTRCVEHRGACNSTWQCCSGLSCVSGLCTNSSCKWGSECNNTAECCTGLYCTQRGVCSVETCAAINSACNTTEDCCFEGKCVNSTCVPRTCASLNETCTSISCCSGLTCMNSKCATPCKISGTCLKDSDCCTGYFCHPAGYCAKQTCTYEYANCTNSSQCCSGLECNNGQCTKHCKITGPCSSNAECCSAYYCDSNNQCVVQPTSTICANSYPTCTGSCASGSCYNTGMGNCICGAYTDSSCASLCSISHSTGRKVHSASECIAGEAYLQGCCCSGGAQAQHNWFCCHSDVIGYTCSQNTCPPASLLISGPYTTLLDCQDKCNPPQQNWYCCRSPIGYNMCWNEPCPSGYTQLNSYFTTLPSCQAYCNNTPQQCTIGTTGCSAACMMAYQTPNSTCGAGGCMPGYIQVYDTTCSQNPPCDRCCCQVAGGQYTQQTCQAYAQSRNFTHYQLTVNGSAWSFSDCYNFAQNHCRDYHNGGTAPNGDARSNCCVWICSDEYTPPAPP